MEIKINQKFLSIPPYISTNWASISTVYIKGSVLNINLMDGRHVEIPGLNPAMIEQIFTLHAAHLDQPAVPRAPTLIKGDMPFRLAIGSMEDMGSSVFQHNPNQREVPNIPEEILTKIVTITKVIAPDEIRNFPKAEPHCNCVHCQIARAMHLGQPENQVATQAPQTEKTSEEETVTENELNFQQWEIAPSGNKLFSVINKLDTSERYSVYLGQPVGCTCGKTGCEHIVAVLRS